MKDLPIACDLSASELAGRAEELLPGLVATGDERQELAGGLRCRFTPNANLLGKIATVIEAERSCCRFLRFRVDVEPAGGAVWFEVTGPQGTVAFLKQLVKT